jgi:transcriptional regulator with XRE-family HTH domain
MNANAQNQNVPDLVKSLRSRLGMTQEQFAKEVGVTFSTINQWENGRRQPQPFLMKHLMDLNRKLTARQKRTGAATAHSKRNHRSGFPDRPAKAAVMDSI